MHWNEYWSMWKLIEKKEVCMQSAFDLVSSKRTLFGMNSIDKVGEILSQKGLRLLERSGVYGCWYWKE